MREGPLGARSVPTSVSLVPRALCWRAGGTVGDLARGEPVQGAKLRYPPGALVILTGLPGAGKTTLLQRLYGMHGAESLPVIAGTVVVIDSSQARRHWYGRLGWAPYPVRRAVVFVTHLTRIRQALLR